jgi:threonine dehydratase
VTPEQALALVRTVRPPTPLEPAPALSTARHEVWLKREDAGPLAAFKWRGALCHVAGMREAGVRCVVTASTGNHGAAVAWAAQRLGLDAHVVLPAGGSAVKRAHIERCGAALHEIAGGLDQAAAESARLAAELGAAAFEDGASADQLLGTGTIAQELAGARAAAIVVPLACGALAGGIAETLARGGDDTPAIGVQVAGFSRLARRLRGLPEQPSGTTFADGLADDRIVEPAFGACRSLAAAEIVGEQDLQDAVRELHDRVDLLVEGAAAAPLALLRTRPEAVPPGRVVLIVSGANLDPALAAQLLAKL